MDVETVNKIVSFLANRIDNHNVTIIESETKQEKEKLTIAKRELMILKHELEQIVKRLGE